MFSGPGFMSGVLVSMATTQGMPLEGRAVVAGERACAPGSHGTIVIRDGSSAPGTAQTAD